jgi:SNF2 family DNA or RNA helicase
VVFGPFFTGKTLQVIAFFAALFERYNEAGPHLVVMPLSVMSSWKTDLQRFGGSSFDVFAFQGDKASREEGFSDWVQELRKARKRYCDYGGITSSARHENGCGGKSTAGTTAGIAEVEGRRRKISVVLTTYELAMRDEHLLRKLRCKGKGESSVAWQYLVVRVL